MNKNNLGIAIFLLGIFFLFMHTTLPFLWLLTGIAYPYPLSSNQGVLFYLQGFSPPIGAVLLVVGSLIYGEGKEISRK